MFTQIFYLVIVLFIISFSPHPQSLPAAPSPDIAIILGSITYAFTLCLILLQNRLFSKGMRKYRHIMLGTANLFLIFFLLANHFLLAFQRALPASAALVSIISLALYFGGLYMFHFSAYPYIPAGSRGLVGSAKSYAINQLRFLFPFCLPFVLITCVLDAVTLIPTAATREWLFLELESKSGTAIFMGLLFILLVVIILFYPPLTIRIWKCRDLPPSELKRRLDTICSEAKFSHAGMKTWTILNHSYTAAIVGILPRFRYVMFTRRLLDELSPRSIGAILVHEIGHSARRHLLYYPAIMLGMLVVFALGGSLTERLSGPWIEEFSSLFSPSVWQLLSSLTVLAAYSLGFFIYLRIVFGYFSRLFERQADLHVYQMDIPVEDMQLALDEIGHFTGGTHQIPCWHHHSIQKRIDFLEETKNNPTLIAKHHRRVRYSLIAYILLMAVGIFFTYTEVL